MESSVEVCEEIPKMASITENLKMNKMLFGLQLFNSYSKKMMLFLNSVIHYFLHADERNRRDCTRRRNRLRTTKKEDFL